ncbi:hypothetical protein [Streptomyces sioyaensis]|nr:hypothetical protein [Streptomyces sioyaensis]
MSTVAAVGQDVGVAGLTGLDAGALEISETWTRRCSTARARPSR